MIDGSKPVDLLESTQSLADLIDEAFTDISSSNIVHDRYQFESKFDFDLKPHGNEKQKNYEIDVYFFIPKAMEINGDTYTKDNFYTDLTNYLRIKTPQLFDWNNSLSNWSLPALDKYIEVYFMTSQRQNLIGSVVQENKFFGCFIDRELKALHEHFLKGLNKNADTSDSDFTEHIGCKIDHIYNLVFIYREKYVKNIRNYSVVTDEEVKRAILLVDEYISYRMENVLLSFLRIMNGRFAEIQNRIEAIFSKESKYKTENKIINLEKDNSEPTRERYHYRLGLLKKYVLEVLYLQRKNIKKEKFYKNIIAAFGAALAAIWAGMADIQRIQLIGNPTGNDAWMRLSAILFLGVIAYVFKDRIKELTKEYKEYINLKIKCYLPDFDILMFYKYFDKNNEEIKEFLGSCKEFFHYLDNNSIAPEISYIRSLGNRSELDPARDETILHYSKKLTFYTNSKAQSQLPATKVAGL